MLTSLGFVYLVGGKALMCNGESYIIMISNMTTDKFCILSFKYDALYHLLVEEHHDWLVRLVGWGIDERILGCKVLWTRNVNSGMAKMLILGRCPNGWPPSLKVLLPLLG